MATPKQLKLNDQGIPENYNIRQDLEIAPRKVKEMLDQGNDFFFVDLRNDNEVDFVSIDNATVIPLSQIMDRIDEFQDNKDKPIVTFCHHGGRSMRATLALREMGLNTTVSMIGGVDLWAIDIEPGKPRY